MISSTPEVGLLACGVSATWSVDVDEALNGPEQLFLNLKSPSHYLYFTLNGLSVISEMLSFLAVSTAVHRCILLGDFSGLPVRLVADNEDLRYFITVGDHAAAHLHLAVPAGEVDDLRSALQQAFEDIEEA